MIKKILIFNYTEYNQFISTLVEGLKKQKNIKLYSTTKLNYCEDITINSERIYSIKNEYSPMESLPNWSNLSDELRDRGPNFLQISSVVKDEDSYIEECEDLIEESDLIIVFSDNNTSPSTYFNNKNDEVITHLHEYAVVNYGSKLVIVDPISTHFINGSYTKYGSYPGSLPYNYKIYFKREKSLDLDWDDNVVPFPRASEDRYFTVGKDFDKIWKNKELDISALFRTSGYKKRIDVKNILEMHYGDSKKCVLKNVFDFGESVDKTIDSKIYGFKPNEIGNLLHHHSYYETLSLSKISVECPQYEGWGFYTYRMWESIANGCCYFYPTPNYNVDFPNGLVDGEDFIIYNTPEDLIEGLHYYLNHPDEMRTIAENGFNKLLKYHTSEVRAKEFIETCERYMSEN